MSVVEKTATVEEKTKEEKDEKSMSLGDLLDEVSKVVHKCISVIC